MSQMRAEIIKTIGSVISKFYESPDYFFNEHEFHNYCYHRFYLIPEFNEPHESRKDVGKRTNILHPEYPTVKRFSRKRLIQSDEERSRARYDLVILKPNFIRNFRMKTVMNRSEDPGNIGRNIFAVIEFKFITKSGESFKHELKYDRLKLLNADEADHKYMVVFSKTKQDSMMDEIRFLQQDIIPESGGINIIYIHLDYDASKNKRHLVIREYPKMWLKYPRRGNVAVLQRV